MSLKYLTTNDGWYLKEFGLTFGVEEVTPLKISNTFNFINNGIGGCGSFSPLAICYIIKLNCINLIRTPGLSYSVGFETNMRRAYNINYRCERTGRDRGEEYAKSWKWK